MISKLVPSKRLCPSNSLLLGTGFVTKQIQKHVVESDFFFDSIDMFSFEYPLYIVDKVDYDADGKEQISYSYHTIRGSLQSNGKSIERSLSGNMSSMTYNFYCKNIYQIDIDDVIYYMHNYFIVKSVQDINEYGCRACTLSLIQLTAYRDLANYVKCVDGDELV